MEMSEGLVQLVAETLAVLKWMRAMQVLWRQTL